MTDRGVVGWLHRWTRAQRITVERRQPTLAGRARRWAFRHLVGHEGEICHVCGGRYSAFIWWADSQLWDAVAGDRYGLLCPRCFTRLADEKGIWVCWAALPHDAWGDVVEVDMKEAIGAWQRRNAMRAGRST